MRCKQASKIDCVNARFAGRRLSSVIVMVTFAVGASVLGTVEPASAAVTLTVCESGAGSAQTTISGGDPVLNPAAPGGHVYLLNTSGSDANTGASGSPWQHFARALPALQPGDALYVRGGTYVERVNPTLVPASSAAPILVAAYPGERPVVQGLFWVHSPDYWTFDGINVTWDPATGGPTEHMVKITNGTNWTWKNSEVWGAHSYADMLVAGTVTGQPANWSVNHNCIHDTYPTNSTNQDHLIYVNTGVNPGSGVIANNLLFNATNGEGVKLGGSDVTVGGAAYVSVWYNTIYNTGQNILVAWQSHDNLFDHNILDKVGNGYGNIRGYQLTGSGNVAQNNIGYDARMFLLNDSGYTGVADGGGNLFPA